MKNLSAGLATLLFFISVSTSHAEPIINLAGTCPDSMLESLEKLNRLNDTLLAQHIKVSKITGAACLPDYTGSRFSKVYIRAYDGRQMIWTPSDGTNDLQRMMLYGR